MAVRIRRLLRWLHGVAGVLAFRSRLFAYSAFYHVVQMWQRVNLLFGRRVGGFEERLEHNMADSIEAKLGYRIRLEDGGKCFG